MQTAPAVLSLLLLVLSCFSRARGLCNLENGTVARCHELGDVKYIETYDLESLKTSVADKVLTPGRFANLTSLRHLDLSGGDLQHVEPGSFRKLVNLKSLDLSDNQIQYLELASLDGLNHLHSLNLRKNRFQQLPPALARLKILRHLDVQGNPLQCNCVTLRVRDLIVKRNVKLSKKTICVGPHNMKGTPLLVPDTTTVCNLEEQDREMQNDQPGEESAGDFGSGDDVDDFDDENEEEEYVKIHNTSIGSPTEPEIETPFPDNTGASTVTSDGTSTDSTSEASNVENSTLADSSERTTNEDEEIYLDSEEKKELPPTKVAHTTEEYFKDALIYPVEGSGDDEEGSGEGSGSGMIFTKWSGDEDEDKDSGPFKDTLFDLLCNVLWCTTTAAPEEKKDPDLEEEQFINISGSNEEEEEEAIVPKRVQVDEAVPSTVEMTTRVNLFSPTNGVELVETETIHDTSKLKNMKVEQESDNDELAEVSPARQSKKGMGSYVVLAALLAVLAALIGFAAYKGDFCRKRRKRGDVENGTEMKDMQKALLDTGNATQPKIASNGNAESMPLVEAATEQESPKEPNGHQTDVPKSLNGTSDCADPVKPPRRTIGGQPDDQRAEEKPVQETGSAKDDSLAGRTSPVDPSSAVANNGPVPQHPEANGPPLSPGAQRVKITLQENPDSVPRTPILITRTLAGENLVKSP